MTRLLAAIGVVHAVQDLGTDIERWLGWVQGDDPAWVFWAIAVVGFIEFVFPPFPGDVVTVGSAFIVRAKGWSLGLAFAASLAGSVAGGFLQFAVGRLIRRRSVTHPDSRLGRLWITLAPWRDRIDTHGALLILVSRFVPVLRAPLIAAAGTTRVHVPLATLAFVVGVAVWNALLFLAGSLAGNNYKTVGRWLTAYSVVIWIALLLLATLWVWRRIRARRRPADERHPGVE